MSFILDALRKSEAERQQQGKAQFAGVPASAPDRTAPRWLWVVGVLLAINLLVLVGLLLRPDGAAREAPAVTRPAVTPIAAAPNATPDAGFAEQVAAAKKNAPQRQPEPTPVAATVEDAPVSAAPVTTTARAVRTSTATASLPTIHQLRAEGKIELQDLHVDIHVYSENPQDRFVFINMTRLKEGAQMPEGPVVAEITSDGVVLRHQGMTFLLPRD